MTIARKGVPTIRTKAGPGAGVASIGRRRAARAVHAIARTRPGEAQDLGLPGGPQVPLAQALKRFVQA